MKSLKNTKTLILTAMFAALTCAATMVIKIPTPTFGYIHPGDGFVILCGVLLGPVPGALAAGIGSAMADVFSGYFSYVPATLTIKALTAVLAYYLSSTFTKKIGTNKVKGHAIILPAGIISETFMVIGYFIYEIFLLGIMAGGFDGAAISAGVAAAISGIPFNIVQGAVGAIIATALCPVLSPIIRRSVE